MTQPADPKTYYAMALDPIHVGTGGYRLGRVDLSIVREPGTNLPKLPGTSLSGACRAYTAMVTGRYRWEEGGKSYCCAGQGQEDARRNKVGHCRQHTCPVCVAFGFAGERSGFQGLAQFADARLLFFPVHSLAGPVWTTCPSILRDAGRPAAAEPTGNRIRLGSGLTISKKSLNLGWLMLEVEDDSFQFDKTGLPVPGEILRRSVLVPDKVFGQIVNDNLEVRTSVSIDPATGAAEERALFTYEAIPRSAVFWFVVTYLNPEFYRIREEKPNPQIDAQPKKVQEVVEQGLAQFEHLGIGGMNTRGMGRLKVYLPGIERPNHV